MNRAVGPCHCSFMLLSLFLGRVVSSLLYPTPSQSRLIHFVCSSRCFGFVHTSLVYQISDVFSIAYLIYIYLYKTFSEGVIHKYKHITTVGKMQNLKTGACNARHNMPYRYLYIRIIYSFIETSTRHMACLYGVSHIFFLIVRLIFFLFRSSRYISYTYSYYTVVVVKTLFLVLCTVHGTKTVKLLWNTLDTNVKLKTIKHL